MTGHRALMKSASSRRRLAMTSSDTRARIARPTATEAREKAIQWRLASSQTRVLTDSSPRALESRNPRSGSGRKMTSVMGNTSSAIPSTTMSQARDRQTVGPASGPHDVGPGPAPLLGRHILGRQHQTDALLPWPSSRS